MFVGQGEVGLIDEIWKESRDSCSACGIWSVLPARSGKKVVKAVPPAGCGWSYWRVPEEKSGLPPFKQSAVGLSSVPRR